MTIFEGENREIWEFEFLSNLLRNVIDVEDWRQLSIPPSSVQDSSLY